MDEDLRLAAIEASKLSKKGKYEEAVDVCTLGISDYPQYSSLYLILAKAYIALGDVTEAHKVFESASKFFVNDPLINTLKDILELTPNDSSTVDKKKSKSITETTSQTLVKEIETKPPKNEDLIEFEKEIELFTNEIAESEDEIKTSIEIISEDSLTNDIFLSVEEEEIPTEELHDIVNSEESEKLFETQESVFEEEEMISLEYKVENLEIVEDLEETLLLEPIAELNEPTEEVLVDIIENLEEINSNNDESESDYHDLLNEFDSLVSSVETEEDAEIYDEDSSDYENEVEHIDPEIKEVETELELTTTTPTNFELPTVHHNASNFLAKVKQLSQNYDSLFYSSEIEQAQQILPQFETFVNSEQKSHLIEEISFILENPLQSEFFTSISELVTEPLDFQETYQSDRSKYSEIVDFEQSIDRIESVSTLFQSSDT